ncbi:MAG: septal ring lytic transglycosylase RlpA family protein [Stellaceae bacterium]
MTKSALAEDPSHRAKKHHFAEAKAKAIRLSEQHRRLHAKAAMRAAERHRLAHHRLARRHLVAAKRRDEDRIIGQVHQIGAAEVGEASWYGGRHIGRRTASGVRLDTVHDTAAHRSLPLDSLARVTNLDNGRSVIVRVTDRGPMSHRLVIDLSPSAAAELRMVRAGIVPVEVEPVALVASASR